MTPGTAYSALVSSAMDHASLELVGDATGHDMGHVTRVLRTASVIAASEGADVERTQLIAALHDIKDFKFTGDEQSGAIAATRWMTRAGVTHQLAETVASDISGISFKGAGTAQLALTLEGKCVQDADRLDAIGAIGIARCFAYGGSVARPIHDPSIRVADLNDAQSYLKNHGTSINHFYEKLLLLKDRMNTRTGRMLAEERHVYTTQFLAEFLAQWSFGNVKS